MSSAGPLLENVFGAGHARIVFADDVPQVARRRNEKLGCSPHGGPDIFGGNGRGIRRALQRENDLRALNSNLSADRVGTFFDQSRHRLLYDSFGIFESRAGAALIGNPQKTTERRSPIELQSVGNRRRNASGSRVHADTF